MWRNLVPVVVIATLWGCGAKQRGSAVDNREQELAKAEAFIDAFYSFDANRLAAVLDHAKSSQPDILYYQGWAQGGNYKVMSRQPCAAESEDSIACPVTVDDDLGNALELSFDVTDTFHLKFSGGDIIAVTTSSDDPPEFYSAEAWVKEHRRELVEGPCQGYFDGGPTPGACVVGMVQGFKEFTALQAGQEQGASPAAN